MGLGGCASAEKIRSLKTGMTTAEVSEEAGNPETIRRQGDQVVWYYRTDDGRCAVVFETEKLSSLACSGDGTESGATTVAVKSASTPPPVFMH
jgi:outer membrane protein assembly factor BamE (lipoprotein component of BamABCDE complex)